MRMNWARSMPRDSAAASTAASCAGVKRTVTGTSVSGGGFFRCLNCATPQPKHRKSLRRKRSGQLRDSFRIALTAHRREPIRITTSMTAAINLTEAAVTTRWWEKRKGSLRGYPFTDAKTMRDRRAEIVWQAQWITRRAIAKGILPHPSEFPCADCGEPTAYCYDHRDYRRPLWVTPLCNPCNGRRPQALPWAPKEHNGNREFDREINHIRPSTWDADSDLDPDLGTVDAYVSEIVHYCPTCGHVAPKKESA